MLFSLIYLIQMLKFAPSLLLPSVFILALMLVFILLSGIIQERVFSKKSKLSAKLNGIVFALISGIQKIKLAGAEKRAFAKWSRAYIKEAKLVYSPPLLLKLNKAVNTSLTLFGTIVIYYFAGNNSGVTLSDYIAFSIAYGAVSMAISSLANITLTIADIRPLLEMIQPVLETVPEIDENKKQVVDLSGEIEISHVSFKYSEDSPQVLDDLSLKINKGEYIGIVGGSGSGKSTLLRTMLAFESPQRGAIYYDGMDLASLDARTVRQRIGTCLQNGQLFVGDIFANITITAPRATLEDAWEAARMAGIADDIKDMPMGMHTVISEGGGGISGGQRQRILIARALVAKPNILFFDEATSALDNITQKVVSDSLDSLGCTRVVIAHRLSTIQNCDRIIVLDKGKIAEIGNYEELMVKEGIFYNLAMRQIT